MTTERERAEIEVDHCLLVMSQCVDDLKDGYRKLYQHEYIIAEKTRIMEMQADLRDLLIAINQTQTGRTLQAAE